MIFFSSQGAQKGHKFKTFVFLPLKTAKLSAVYTLIFRVFLLLYTYYFTYW